MLKEAAKGPRTLMDATGDDYDEANALFQDIVSNKSLWMDKVLRTQPTNGTYFRSGILELELQSETVCFILSYLGNRLLRCKKPLKAFQVMDLVIESHKVTKEIIYATPLSAVFEGPRDEFASMWYCNHTWRLFAAAAVNAKLQAVESFRIMSGILVRRDTRELAGVEPIYQAEEFTLLVDAAGQRELLQRATREDSETLLMGVFDEIGDDKIWDFLHLKFGAPSYNPL